LPIIWLIRIIDWRVSKTRSDERVSLSHWGRRHRYHGSLSKSDTLRPLHRAHAALLPCLINRSNTGCWRPKALNSFDLRAKPWSAHQPICRKSLQKKRFTAGLPAGAKNNSKFKTH